MAYHIFTSESVSEGHPDKVADQISDGILDAVLALDSEAHVAAETFVGPDFVANLGELSATSLPDLEQVAREVVRDIGYNRPEERFCWNTFQYLNRLQQQSPDIAQGVNRGAIEEQGAGDQGMMFGYATNETPNYMPAPVAYSHLLIEKLTECRHAGKIAWLRPDAKSQVSVVYDGNRIVRIADIVISHQTEASVEIGEIRRVLEAFAREALADTGLVDAQTRFHINPTGRFVIGGPAGDSGLTGRKIIVDTYGGASGHGGGCFSGKDPSKVDRSAAYYSRYVAKNLVAAGVADRCELQVSYAIGEAKPVSLYLSFFGTGHGVSEEKATELILDGGLFDFRPGMIIEAFSLKKPQGWRYRQTTNGGHFGRGLFPWEKLDKVDAIRSALGL